MAGVINNVKPDALTRKEEYFVRLCTVVPIASFNSVMLPSISLIQKRCHLYCQNSDLSSVCPFLVLWHREC